MTQIEQNLNAVLAAQKQARRDSMVNRWLIIVSMLLGVALRIWQWQERGAALNTNSGNIQIGTPTTGQVIAPSRDYLTVEEVATREGKSQRTIIEWIESGRIKPAPTKTARAWMIPGNYRNEPLSSANSSNPPKP